MVIRGEISVGKQSVRVEVENNGTMLRITGPYSKRPVSFKGRARMFPVDRLFNGFRLALGSRSPMRCAFSAVRLEPSEDGLNLKIDPGWPWDEPLAVKIACVDRGILAEWNQAATSNLLHGRPVRPARRSTNENGQTHDCP